MGGVVSSAVQPSGGMSPGGLGGAIQGAVQPAFQGGEGFGGLKAGVAPNTSNITPMPTMTHDLVQPAGAPVPMPIMGDNAPRFEGPRTGGPGMGPTPDIFSAGFANTGGGKPSPFGGENAMLPLRDTSTAQTDMRPAGFGNTGGGKPAPGSLGSAFNADLTYAANSPQPTADSGMRPAAQLSPVVQNYYAQDFANQANRGQMQQSQFQQPRQQQFNPFTFNPQMQRLQGLQQLYSMFSSPQMRAPMQMPMYRSPALNYRPNIQQVQQNLSRVKPSVYKTDLDAARARIAELEAAQQPQDTGYNYSGG